MTLCSELHYPTEQVEQKFLFLAISYQKDTFDVSISCTLYTITHIPSIQGCSYICNKRQPLQLQCA